MIRLEKVLMTGIYLSVCGLADVSAIHEHGESRQHDIHTAKSRITRWHVHNKNTIPVHNMRVDCMGGQLQVLDMTLIQTGSLCHANRSKPYLQKLSQDIQECSNNASCSQVEWTDTKLDTRDCVRKYHHPIYFCQQYLAQYLEQCLQLFSVEFFNTSQITALDIEVKCVGIDQDLDYSVVVMHDQQSINIGHLITECKSVKADKFLKIVGFVEAAEKCPADKYKYTTPYSHPLVKVLQDNVQKETALISFDTYQHDLSLRLICGNVVFPVVYDGLVPLSRAHGWIYYRCGDLDEATLTWDHYWINFTRENFNGTHSMHSATAVHNHCSWGHKLFVFLLIILLVMAVSFDVFTIYRRDDIVAFLRANRKRQNQHSQVGVQQQMPSPEPPQMEPYIPGHYQLSTADNDLLSNNTSTTTLRALESSQLLPRDNNSPLYATWYPQISNQPPYPRPPTYAVSAQPTPAGDKADVTQPGLAGGDSGQHGKMTSALRLPKLFGLRSRQMGDEDNLLRSESAIPAAWADKDEVVELDVRPKTALGVQSESSALLRPRPALSGERNESVTRAVSRRTLNTSTRNRAGELRNDDDAVPNLEIRRVRSGI